MEKKRWIFSHGASGGTKHSRREAAEREDRLEDHRIVLSKDPVIQEKLKALQKIFRKVQSEHPELVGLTLYGSHTKGYAAHNSDLEGYIFIDDSKKIAGTRWAAGVLLEEIKEEPKLAADENNLVNVDIHMSVIDKQVQDLLSSGNHGNDYLMRFFFFSIGDKLRPYRERIISLLEDAGEKGEERWRSIVEYLWEFENTGFSGEVQQSRRSRYPWTLSDARVHFMLPLKKERANKQDLA